MLTLAPNPAQPDRPVSALNLASIGAARRSGRTLGVTAHGCVHPMECFSRTRNCDLAELSCRGVMNAFSLVLRRSTIAALLFGSTSILAQNTALVPGKAIGPWTLEMTIDDLTRLNGPKTPVGQPDGEAEIPLRNLQDSARLLWAHRWDKLRLRAVTFERESIAVEGLTTPDPAYRTAEGIGVGSYRTEVERAYGPPTAVTKANDRQVHLIYDSMGITFRVGNESTKVELVNIFPAATARQRWRMQ